ncbi:MAG: hypothetical protein JO167_08070 [Alphaproteobacteria bacterium]|nr:hypothetical protein [Alphaproteobacteria bacterium]
MIRRLLFVALGIVGIVAIALGLLYWDFKTRFQPEPPSVDYPAPQNALEAQRQDLDYFAKLVAVDRAYTAQARAEANREISALAASTHLLTKSELRVAMMRIGALADNGHTGVYGVPGNPPPNQVPIRVTDFSDGIYILRAKQPHADLLGGQLLSIDNHPIAQVMDKIAMLRGGVPAWRRYLGLRFLTSPEILAPLGVAAKPTELTLTIRRRDGTQITRVLAAETMKKGDVMEDHDRWLSPLPTKTEGPGWLTALPANAALPLPLQDFNTTFRRVWIDNSCVLFIQMKSITDTETEKIGDFLKATEADMARHPCAVILDLRYNGGGDYTNTYAFAHRLPQLVTPGAKIYILTGPGTFSAAITTAAFVKEAFGDRAVILGEPVGDRLKFLSEGRGGCLPHQPLCFHYTTGMHAYDQPCTDWRICYWVNYFYPVRVKSLKPDQLITISFADYLRGRDHVFDRAVALAEGH